MAKNKGKEFEAKLANDFIKIPNATIDRLYDPGFGMKGLSNICDFIAYCKPFIFYLECKTTSGNTFPISNLTQYDRLLSKKNENCPGVRAGVVIWWWEKDVVAYVPIKTIEKMKLDGQKSVNRKFIGTSEYNIIEIPSKKKRVYMDSDYSILMQLSDDEVLDGREFT